MSLPDVSLEATAVATAERMVRLHKSVEKAREWADLHVCSYPSTHPNYHYWKLVEAQLRGMQ